MTPSRSGSGRPDRRRDHPPALHAVPGGLAAGTQAVKSAERAVRLLELLAESPRRLSPAELQELTGIPKSSLHVLLRTLTDAGWVEQGRPADGFGIGPRALICGTAYLDRDRALRYGIAAITAVRDESGYTSHYGRLDGSNVLYLATQEATASTRSVSRVGRCLPAHLTALGLAMLADRTDEEIRELLPARLEPLTEYSITDPADLLAEIERTRAAGYAVERQQNSADICCIARGVGYRIPVTDSISCSLPLAMATKKELARVAELLARHVDELAATLRRAGIR